MSLNKDNKLFTIPNCKCDQRAKQWTGALLGQKAIGCAVNVMVFLDLLNQTSGLEVIPQLNPQIGTDIQHIIDYIKQYYPYTILYRQDFLFQSKEDISFLLNLISDELKKSNDSCLILKLNRSVGVGHTVIMTWNNGKLYTVDPQQSSTRARNDDKIYNSCIKKNETIVVI